MSIWNFIINKLNDDRLVYLMINIQSYGSSPGRQGFAMAVCSDNSLYGSIGGGSMEHRLVEDCKQMLVDNKQQTFIKRQVHKGNVTDGSGMICSGEQTIAFVALTPSHIKQVAQIISCINDKKTGIFELTSSGFNFNLSDLIHDTQYKCSITNDSNWIYSEVIGFRNTIYIVGAGHVGFAVSQLFSQLGFKVVMIDNRPDLDMLNDNTFADEKLIIDYKNVADYVTENKNNYVVIMTNNHTHDQEVLSLLIRKKVKYIGLMGSKEKVAGLKKAMRNNGFTNDELNHVHSPIGISINSKTPGEIAISIAAEIIGVKNKL